MAVILHGKFDKKKPELIFVPDGVINVAGYCLSEINIVIVVIIFTKVLLEIK